MAEESSSDGIDITVISDDELRPQRDHDQPTLDVPHRPDQLVTYEIILAELVDTLNYEFRRTKVHRVRMPPNDYCWLTELRGLDDHDMEFLIWKVIYKVVKAKYDVLKRGSAHIKRTRLYTRFSDE
jgi:hypothetical protein